MMSGPIMKVTPKPKCKSKTTVTFRVPGLNGPKGNFSLIFMEYRRTCSLAMAQFTSRTIQCNFCY